MKRWSAKEISRTLTNEIIAGKYPEGTLLPTRTALTARFSVARATIDNAVRDLVLAGMIQSRRGAGSIIINSAHLYRLAIIGNVADAIATIHRNDITLTSLTAASISTRATREQLRQFDGILWNMPDKKALRWAKNLDKNQPQIIINRTPETLNYVSTDHVDAIFKITEERIKRHPTWLPVFLNLSNKTQSEVIAMRQNGFIKACRKHRIFYETITLPASFKNKVNILSTNFNNNEKLIIVSGSRANTGAVMTWAEKTNRNWGENLLYSDFDNNFEENVWGKTVTSFIQDYTGMLDTAISSLIDIIQKKKRKVQILQPPFRRNGDT
jgi:DNA-binding FadR family transcriptional regulator